MLNNLVFFGKYSGANWRKTVRSIPVGISWIELLVNGCLAVHVMEHDFLYIELRQFIDGNWQAVGTQRWWRNGHLTN